MSVALRLVVVRDGRVVLTSLDRDFIGIADGFALARIKLEAEDEVDLDGYALSDRSLLDHQAGPLPAGHCPRALVGGELDPLFDLAEAELFAPPPAEIDQLTVGDFFVRPVLTLKE